MASDRPQHCWVWLTNGNRIWSGCAHCNTLRVGEFGGVLDWTEYNARQLEISQANHAAGCVREHMHRPCAA